MKTAKNESIKFCNETIHPGESVTFALPLPEIFSCAPMHMPIKVTHGKLVGPKLLVFAGMHGNELNGTEIINLLQQQKALKQLRGTLIMVPFVNVYGLITRSRFLPGEIDLDRYFPGNPKGSHAARMAHLFVENIFSMADICIDLQTGLLNSANLPQIYTNLKDEACQKIARYFDTPVISHSVLEKGSLRAYAAKRGKPYLIYEAGEALRFDQQAIKCGISGLINLMRSIGMLPTKARKKPIVNSVIAEKNTWVTASSSGIVHTVVKCGQYVKKQETLCEISDPFDTTSPVKVKCPHEGIIVGVNELPLVHEGEGIFQLAVFPRVKKAASSIQDWQNEMSTDQEQQGP